METGKELIFHHVLWFFQGFKDCRDNLISSEMRTGFYISSNYGLLGFAMTFARYR